MANSNDKYRLSYGAPNYTPDNGGGSGFSVGRVGNAVQDLSSPGRTVGSGVGVKFNTSFGGSGGGGGGSVSTSDKLMAKTAVKKNAKGGPAKKSGCEVKAYGDMIRAIGKKANGGKVRTSSDTARKLATEMGGMKKGGVQKKADGGMPQMPKPQPEIVVTAPKALTPPNSSAPAATRAGRHVANTTSARAIQPLPEVSPSCHILNCATA